MYEPLFQVERGNVDYFKEVSKEVLLTSRDRNLHSLLARAVLKQDFNCVKVIHERCPELLYSESVRDVSALHHAAARNNLEILKFLINADAQSQGREANQRLVRMQDYMGHAPLMVAVKNKKYDAVKLLYEADPHFHHPPDKEDRTPLKFCMSRTGMQEMFKLLLEIAPDQSKTPMGPNGWTVLHYAAFNGDQSSIADILRFCPDCSKVVDNKGQNFLHIATLFEKAKVVRFCIVEKNVIASNVLNGQDNNGWTTLHHAASRGDAKVVMDIINYCPDCLKLVDNEGMNFLHVAAKFERIQLVKDVLASKKIQDSILNEKDNDGNTPLHVYYDKRKAGIPGVTDQLLKEQSDFDLVVGALIATVSFTAGITVPGGYISDGPKKGNAVLAHKIAFQVFVISNTLALLFSLYAVFSHYCTRRLSQRQDILYQLKVATNCTLGAIYAMMAAFIAGSFTVLANSTGLAFSVCAICCCFYILGIRPMWKILMQKRGESSRGQPPPQASGVDIA